MNSLGYHFTTGSIRKKLIGFFLVTSLLPTLVIGLLSYASYRTAITRKIADYSLAQLTQAVANIQLKLAEFENISVRLFINKEFNNTLTEFVNAKDPIQIATAKKDVEAHFNEYMISNPDIFAFMFFNDRSDEQSIIITKDFPGEFRSLIKHFKGLSAYQGILRGGGGIVWSAAIKVKRSHFVLLGRQIKEMATGKPLGVLAIIIDEEMIDLLANMTIYNRLNISFNEIDNYSLVINNNGEIVSSPFKNDIGKNITKVMKDTQPLQKLFSPVSNRDYGSDVNQGSFLTEINHRQNLVTYKTISSKIGIGGRSGWHLLSLTPTSYLYQEVSTIGFHTILLGLAFAICAVVISLYLSAVISSKKES
ncbi:cache domain-containing protein [Hydrogenispora ethanolica]|uniref:Cache domain-containing protein n=1 Tax=Hydrogenispora ethanolica TaxID=1082276 RepID=A0A4R1RTN6_HYDET|nr:cache domain-containing protein [Hydrogenispora ethanolica]TCL69891.1 cache domain-containing protein [Hydrogenispora ethanolica]